MATTIIKNTVAYLRTMSLKKEILTTTVDINDTEFNYNSGTATKIADIVAKPSIVYLTGYCSKIFLRDINTNVVLTNIVKNKKYKTCNNNTIIYDTNTTFVNTDMLASAEYLQDLIEYSNTLNIDFSYYSALNIKDLQTAIVWIQNNEITELNKFCVNKSKELDDIEFNSLFENFMSITYDRDTNELNELNKTIDDLLSRLRIAKDRYYELNEKHQRDKDNNSNIIKNALQLIKRNKNSKLIAMRESYDTVSLYVYTDFLKLAYTYNDDSAIRYIDTWFNNVSNSSMDLERKKQLKSMYYDALLGRQRYEILLLPIRIEIVIDKRTKKVNFNIDKEYQYLNDTIKRKYIDSGYNVHWFNYQCLGGFKTDIGIAIANRDIRSLYQQLLQYIQTINIGDAAGTAWLHKENMVFYDKACDKYYHVNIITDEYIEIPKKNIYFNYEVLKDTLSSNGFKVYLKY